MEKRIDDITYIDKGKYVIIINSEQRKSLCSVSYAKKFDKRFFEHKHKRYYIE